MQIINIKINNLYGYIDKQIDFNSDLTLLVGINGSGKTSILNLINWVISPSLPNLCVTEFKSIELIFRFKRTKYTVKCTHNKSTFKYIIATNKKTYNPLVVNIHKKPSEIKNDEFTRENLFRNYSSLRPDEEEKETWELISRFPNPTVIGLDRNLYTEESSENIYFEENLKSRLVRKRQDNSSNPLERVKEIVNTRYRKQKNLVLNLTNNLKNQLMLSTFDGNITFDSMKEGIRYKLNHNQIVKAETRVKEYFQDFEDNITEKQEETINNYFSKLKDITKQHQKNPTDKTVELLYSLNANQFIKVRNLLREFEKFEKESDKAMHEVNNYVETLNHFFKDSAKKIGFKEDTSELTFNTLDKKGNEITKYKDISFLSSGEQQILILFSYIAFNSQDGKIFIIDEPELSLHIKWQEDFLDLLEKITPKKTQLILATHSPILANKKKEKAIVLLPYNE